MKWTNFKFIKEFKEFAIKGNALDLAVGVIIGTAFGKIVTSLVNDVIMPPIGVLVGGVNFKEIKIVLKKSIFDENGTIVSPEVSLLIGNFLQTVFDFTIIALVIFILIRTINRIKNLNAEEERKNNPDAAPKPSNEEILLTEIRDLLKNKN
jgi:large conductance mechanosensitive channel